jgi:trk system potassium uptake protein
MRIVVLGCGRVGAGVARELAARGVEVTAVDLADDALARLGEGFSGRLVRGSVLDRQVLSEAGLDQADAAAVVTGLDQTNAAVALAARRICGVPTVVARLYDPRTAEVYQRLGIRTVAPVTWGIQRIADLVTSTHVTTTATLGAGGVEIVEVHVPALLDGRPASELQVEGEIHVVAVTRHGRTTLASPASLLRVGDLAHLAVGVASVGRLDTLLAQR